MRQPCTDGQCQTWAALMYYSIRAQGLEGKWEMTGVVANTFPKEGFMVNPWKYNNNGTNQAGTKKLYPWLNNLGSTFVAGKVSYPGVIMGTNAYDFVNPDVSYLGLASKDNVGQNNPNPFAIFYNHVVVKSAVTGKVTYYDPSYGLTYSGGSINAALADMQKQAISGFFNADDVAQKRMIIRKAGLVLRELGHAQ